MAKVKVSATVDPERLSRAKELIGSDNVSEVINDALAALIERHLEQLHADGYTRAPQDEETVDSVDGDVWSQLPWDDE